MKIEGLIMGSVTNSNLIIPKLISDFPQMPGRGKTEVLRETKCCGPSLINGALVAVIVLLNLLIFQMMFALSQPYVLRARERSLEASDRGHVWVTVVLSSNIELSQLKETPSATWPEPLAAEQSVAKSQRPI